MLSVKTLCSYTAADIVADPSAPDAFVDGIMEGKDWVWDGGILREKYAEKTYKQINTLADGPSTARE